MTARITRAEDGIEVRSPAPHIRWQILVVLSWVPFIAAGLVALWVTGSSFPTMAGGGAGGLVGGLFFVGFSLIVFLGCVAGLISGLYGLLGTEAIRADASGIRMHQELGPFRMAQHYPPYRIRNVRVHVPPEDWGNWSPPPPRVLFDTPGKVRGFGSGLTAEEAAEVATTVSGLLERAEGGDEGPAS